MGRMLNPKKKKSSIKLVAKDEQKTHVMDYSTINLEAAEALYSNYEQLMKTTRNMNILDPAQQESIMKNFNDCANTDPGRYNDIWEKEDW